MKPASTLSREELSRTQLLNKSGDPEAAVPPLLTAVRRLVAVLIVVRSAGAHGNEARGEDHDQEGSGYECAVHSVSPIDVVDVRRSECVSRVS